MEDIENVQSHDVSIWLISKLTSTGKLYLVSQSENTLIFESIPIKRSFGKSLLISLFSTTLQNSLANQTDKFKLTFSIIPDAHNGIQIGMYAIKVTDVGSVIQNEFDLSNSEENKAFFERLLSDMKSELSCRVW